MEKQITVALNELKDNLDKYIKLAETTTIVVTDNGKTLFRFIPNKND